MSKIIKQIIGNDRLNQAILLGLIVVSGFLVFLYWQNNTLAIYDASGHLSAVESARDFWPLPSGWNAWELLGWPQGVFYPSFFHWLAAGLSFLVGTTIAVKLLIAAAFLALPFSISVFVRTFVADQVWRGVTTLVLFSFILFTPDFLGSNIRSFFHLGLLPNFFVLPLAFLFLASLAQTNFKNFLMASLLLSLLIITHFVAGMIGIFYLGTLLLTKILFEGKPSWRPPALVLVVAPVLTAFFWLPFIINRQYTSVATHGIITSYLWPNIVVVVFSLALLLYSLKTKKENIFVLSLASGAISTLTVIDSILFRMFGTSFLLETLSVYRFQIFAYLFFTSSLLGFFAEQRWLEKYKSVIKAGTLLIFFSIVVGLLLKNPADYSAVKVSLEDPRKVSGRFLETFRRTETFPVVYEFQTRLEKENPQSSWAFGVFPESSATAPFVQSLIKSLRRDAYPEEEGAALETKFVDQDRIQQLLDLLGINYLINLEETKKGTVGDWVGEDETKYYNLEKVSETPLFEVIGLSLEPIENNWNQAVESWWLEEGAVKSLPYFVNGELLPSKCLKELEGTQVKILSANRRQTKFELEINSKKPVPVLAKVSYFPYWSASSAGKVIPIYRAAPNLMLLYANGEVNLEYKEPVWVKGLYIVSGITLLVVGLYFFRKNQRE